MPEKDSDLGWLAKLGVTIHEVLRYCCGGLLAFLVGTLIDPDGVEKVVESLTVTMSILIALALGGVIYAAYRPLVGALLWWLAELVHSWWSKWQDGRGKGRTCCTHYFMSEWRISRRLAREAFRTVRSCDAFNQDRQREFYRQHSELHTVYVTSVVLFVGAIVVWVRQPTGTLVSGWTLAIVAIFFGISACVGDMSLCCQECKALLLVPKDKVRECLEGAEFIPRHGNDTHAQEAVAS
jgi:hypothetical protein